jgi:glycerol kinase
VHVSAVTEATTLGAAYLAGTALGVWGSLAEATATWRSSHSLDPAVNPADRLQTRSSWRRAVESAQGWIPDLSALDF